MSAISPAPAPPAGWYPDPAEPSVLRYWDGAQWTTDMQPALQPSLPPAPVITNRAAIGIVLALGALITLLSVFIDGGGEGGSSTESLSEEQILTFDADAKAGVRTAQTAIETYATDHDGAYAGATPEGLRAIEQSTPESLAVTADAQTYSVTVESETGSTFSIARDAAGQIGYACEPLGAGGCPDSGNWAAP